MAETWTITVRTATGCVVYEMEVDIEPEHRDSSDGLQAIFTANSQLIAY